MRLLLTIVLPVVTALVTATVVTVSQVTVTRETDRLTEGGVHDDGNLKPPSVLVFHKQDLADYWRPKLVCGECINKIP